MSNNDVLAVVSFGVQYVCACACVCVFVWFCTAENAQNTSVRTAQQFTTNCGVYDSTDLILDASLLSVTVCAIKLAINALLGWFSLSIYTILTYTHIRTYIVPWDRFTCVYASSCMHLRRANWKHEINLFRFFVILSDSIWFWLWKIVILDCNFGYQVRCCAPSMIFTECLDSIIWRKKMFFRLLNSFSIAFSYGICSLIQRYQYYKILSINWYSVNFLLKNFPINIS